MTEKECLQILGLETEYTSEQLKEAHRTLAQVWHPDRFQHNDKLRKRSETEMQRINEAFQVLNSKKFTYAEYSPPSKPSPPQKPSPRSQSNDSKRTTNPPPRSRPREYSYSRPISQEEIERILNKVTASGYDSLSEEEQSLLFTIGTRKIKEAPEEIAKNNKAKLKQEMKSATIAFYWVGCIGWILIIAPRSNPMNPTPTIALLIVIAYGIWYAIKRRMIKNTIEMK